MTASLDTFVISFFITGRFVPAGSIAGTELFTRTLISKRSSEIFRTISFFASVFTRTVMSIL